MPATPDRIAFITRSERVAVWEDPAVKTAWGAAARSTGGTPIPGFFDLPADQEEAVADLGSLLGQDRRRFEVSVADILSFDGALSFAEQAPSVRLLDTERGSVDRTVLIAGITAIDFERQTTTLELWG